MTQNSPKVAEKILCSSCDYVCYKKSDFNKHLLTRKHKIMTQNDANVAKSRQKKYRCSCGKEYSYRQGLYAHNQVCTIKESINENKILSSSSNNNDIESLTTLVIEVVKSNAEFQKQIFDLVKNSNITNNTNCHNTNTFNLQVFLNEQCKDAMNINDFVDSFDLQVSDLENVGRLGYIEGMSNIIISKIKELDVHMRPIHCSDLKREIIYIKDDDKWEREDANNTKFRKVIKRVSGKNIGMLNAWREIHPDCLDSESAYNDIYMKLIVAAMGANDIEGNENKIMKKISKHVVIDKKNSL